MTKDELKGLAEKVRKGERVALGKAITLVESLNPDHREDAGQLIDLCLPFSGKSVRIGITGVPGVGKSTFIESFGNYLIKEQGKKVAVLAIDPSSAKSKGSILGDKTRMNLLSQSDQAFIRPSPTSGNLGGVSLRTRESIILCEAAGFNTILIETVGVGQSETEVSAMTDFFLLLMLAGAGDELQGMKRGIMEMADLVVIHKADGSNIDAAKKAAGAYKNALHLFPARESQWVAKALMASSTENTGHDAIWSEINKYVKLTSDNGFFEQNRKNQALLWMKKAIESTLKDKFYSNIEVAGKIEDYKIRVVKGAINPAVAANELIELFRKSQE